MLRTGRLSLSAPASFPRQSNFFSNHHRARIIRFRFCATVKNVHA